MNNFKKNFKSSPIPLRIFGLAGICLIINVCNHLSMDSSSYFSWAITLIIILLLEIAIIRIIKISSIQEPNAEVESAKKKKESVLESDETLIYITAILFYLGIVIIASCIWNISSLLN